MAVPCQRCGRAYDVALFQFGRTISCTCGKRVGIEAEVRTLRGDGAVRFAADAMLGRLARWLRLLGFDCIHDPAFTDEGLVRAALAEGRAVLTRDRRLAEEWWVDAIYVVREQAIRAQLAEVVQRFELAGSFRVLTRCGECNRVLERVRREDVAESVPARVSALHDEFSRCPHCGRVFWEGTHARRIRAIAACLLRAA